MKERKRRMKNELVFFVVLNIVNVIVQTLDTEDVFGQRKGDM